MKHRTVARVAIGGFVAGLCIVALAVDPTAPGNQPDPPTTTLATTTTSTVQPVITPVTAAPAVLTEVGAPAAATAPTPAPLVRHHTEAADIVVTAETIVEEPAPEIADPVTVEAPAEQPCDYLDEHGQCQAFPPPPDIPDCRDTQGAEPCWFHGAPEDCVADPETSSIRHCFPLAPEPADG